MSEQRTLTEIAAANVREWRRERGLSQEELAAELRALGLTVTREVVAKLETGRRESLTVEELLVLALALNVSPSDLLTAGAADGVEIAVTPTMAAWPGEIEAFLKGYAPPLLEDKERERADFLRKRPRDEQLIDQALGHPALAAMAALHTAALNAVLRGQLERGALAKRQPKKEAAKLRKAAERAAAYMSLLADELDLEGER